MLPMEHRLYGYAYGTLAICTKLTINPPLTQQCLEIDTKYILAHEKQPSETA